jgi:hypothetical protein
MPSKWCLDLNVFSQPKGALTYSELLRILGFSALITVFPDKDGQLRLS